MLSHKKSCRYKHYYSIWRLSHPFLQFRLPRLPQPPLKISVPNSNPPDPPRRQKPRCFSCSPAQSLRLLCGGGLLGHAGGWCRLASPPRPVPSSSAPTRRCSGYLFEEGAATESELPTAYDLPGIAAVYRRRPLLVLRRSLQIGTSFGRWFALRYLDRVNERADDMFEVRAAR